MATPSPLDIVCGTSLGPFVLGSRLHEVLAIIRREAYRDVTVSWDERHAPTSALLVALKSPPLRLAFAGASQRLAFIELLEPAQWASYKSSTLRVDDGAATMRGIAKLFGPTTAAVPHPAHADERLVSYAAGVAFSSAGTALKRVIVHPSSAQPLGAGLFAAALSAPRRREDGGLDAAVIALRSAGKSTSVELQLLPSASEPARQVEIDLGKTTPEDLLCDLGPADQTFYKQDDRLRGVADDLVPPPGAYFLVYFSLGVDFMLDSMHRVRKIVLHSNLPGADPFGRYARCSWTMTTSSSSTVQWSDQIDAAKAALSSTQPAPRKAVSSRASPAPAATSLPASTEQPLVLDRTADALDSLAIGRSTTLHGLPGVVFEATEAGDIETLWLV